MSIIFGIKEESEITIAGDKRVTSINGDFLSDDVDKVIVINEYLAFAIAGNNAVKTLIMQDIEKTKDKEKMSSDDLLDLIKCHQNAKGIRNSLLQFSALIAGRNRSNVAVLISCDNSLGYLSELAVEMSLFPPDDAMNEMCCNIFAKNYNMHHSEFVEKTILDVSDISKLVSPTGDKWVYNIKTGKGVLHRFCN